MPQGTLTRLMENRDAIRRIMAKDNNGTMDRMVENAVRSGAMTYSEDGASYNPTFSNNDGKVIVNEEVMKKSRMPKAILESFKENPGSSTTMPASVLDELGLENLEKMRRETVQESVPVHQVPQSSQAVDYSLLRTIINEAVQENVKKYMSALSKKLINESASQGAVQAVKLGKNFSFITEDGKVYEATLKYKTTLETKK